MSPNTRKVFFARDTATLSMLVLLSMKPPSACLEYTGEKITTGRWAPCSECTVPTVISPVFVPTEIPSLWQARVIARTCSKRRHHTDDFVEWLAISRFQILFPLSEPCRDGFSLEHVVPAASPFD